MFSEFIKQVIVNAVEKVKQEAIAEGRYFEEENILLHRDTVSLMEEIGIFHTQSAIDKALRDNDKVAFLQLTGDVNA